MGDAYDDLESFKPNPPEVLFHDEDTMMKVAEGIREVVGDDFKKVQDIVSSLQNRGIKFREVRTS